MAGRREIVLVTGGSGLVGRCLADECTRGVSDRDFVFISSKDADLTCSVQTRSLFEQYKPDHVVHLAAKVGGLFANLADSNNEFYEQNRRMNENVLALGFEFQVKRCISCLSTCIFPDAIELPLDETKVHAGPPHESNYGYAMAKRQVDLLNRHYNSMRRRPASSGQSITANASPFFALVPTNLYGPHDNFNPQQSHVVPGLIDRAHKAAALAREGANGQEAELTVFGSGQPLRQFVFARDLAKLILWALDHFEDALEPLLIVSPDEKAEISIGQAAELICNMFSERFKVDMKTRYDTSKSDGQLKKTASNRKLRRLRPEFEFTPFELGLRETVDWFCSQYPRVRGAMETCRR